MGAGSDSGTNEPGTVGWTYQVSNAATQYQAAGQTATEKFTIRSSDRNTGGNVNQLVTSTDPGTNDAPTITVAGTDADGAVTEDATTPNLSDTDRNSTRLNYRHGCNSSTVSCANTNTLAGTLTMGAVSESATTEPGTV